MFEMNGASNTRSAIVSAWHFSYYLKGEKIVDELNTKVLRPHQISTSGINNIDDEQDDVDDFIMRNLAY